MQVSIATQRACAPCAPAGRLPQQLRTASTPVASRPRTGAAAAARRPLCSPAPAHVPHASPRAVAAAAAGRYEVPSSAAGSIVLEVCADEAAVAAYLCDAVEAAATAAIAARGVFTLAIPGGSVLKALAGLTGRKIDWSKVKLFFVNHKAVPNEDADTSSYAKARAIFLDAVEAPAGCVATLIGSYNVEVEASAYAAALAAAADAAGMERAPSGAPRFDLMLLGVGGDGHVGSLYPKDTPGGAATLADPAGAWVLPVVKAKPPASITLSLGVMNAARSVVVCMTGPKKAAAAKLALETPVPAGDFPAQLVQPDLAPAVWLLDEAAAAELEVVKAGASGTGTASSGSAGSKPQEDAGAKPEKGAGSKPQEDGAAEPEKDGAAKPEKDAGAEPDKGAGATPEKDPRAGELQKDGSILYTF